MSHGLAQRRAKKNMMDGADLAQIQLELVNFEKDRQQIFESMVSRPLVVSAMARDKTQFHFAVDKIERSQLFLILRGPAARRPEASEVLVITFGLDEGQFFIRAQVEAVAGELYVLPIGEKLYRLQRRSNFRALVPDSMLAHFRLRQLRGSAVMQDLPLADVSGGGLGLLLPKTVALQMAQGDEITGLISIAGREPLEVHGVVRHVLPQDREGTVKVGVQCHHVSLEKERELVAICMQIHRELYSLFRRFNR